MPYPASVVAIHGGPGMDCSYFRPYLDGLCSAFCTRFLDLKGSSVEGFLGQINDFISALPPRPVVLLGHSFGAALTIDYISRFPSKVAMAILIAPIYDTKWIEIFSSRFSAREEDLRRRIALAKPQDDNASFREETISYVDLYFNKDYIATGRQILARISYNKKVYDTVTDGYTSSLDLRERLHHLPVPSLFIAGEDDYVVPASYVKEGANLTAKSTLKIVRGAGHFPFVERPQEVVKTISDFIQGHL